MKTRRQETKQTHHQGIIIPLLDRIARYYGKDPGILKHLVTKAYPDLLKKECCANCGASMAEYTHQLDTIDGLLIYGMARMIREKLKDPRINFTQANQIHVQSKMNAYYSVASRTTWCSKLGLIAKVLRKDKDGKLIHDQKAGWLITTRGWSFLKGEPVPSSVTTFRNRIIDRPTGTTTIEEVFSSKSKRLNGKYAMEVSTYKKNEWVDITGYAEGKII